MQLFISELNQKQPNTILTHLTVKLDIMDFVKRTSIILIVIATIASSCDKHSNEVMPCIYSKLDVLASKFNGVTELCTDLAIMRDKITSLQKSIPTLDETSSILVLRKEVATIKSRNDSIASIVNKLATNGTTRVLIDGLKDDLTALSIKVIADNDIMTSQIKRNGSANIIQTYLLNELLVTNNALVKQIANVQKTLNSLTAFSGDSSTQVAVDVLVVQMNCVKVSFDILLANYEP